MIGSGTAITSEGVWNEDPLRSATGGGVSDFFAVPTYQSATGIPVSANAGGHKGRGAPDVAGDADPATGYVVRVDGQEFVIGGTTFVDNLEPAGFFLSPATANKPSTRFSEKTQRHTVS